jgi:DNA-binding CsgD family transcriptional regulator
VNVAAAGQTLGAKRLMPVLDVVRSMNGAEDGAFFPTMLGAVAGIVACDSVSYNEHDLREPRERRYLIEPRYAERGVSNVPYHRHLAQHPVFGAVSSGRLAPGSCASVSDLTSARSFRRLPLYTEYYRWRGVEDQLVALVGAGPGRCTLLVFNRSRRGFGPADRAVVELVLPHLRQAVGQRRRLARLRRTVAARHAHSPVPGPGGTPGGLDWAALTPREREVVASLAGGASDHQIGRALGISERTVGKHLENVYRKLDLPGRVVLMAALARPALACA